MTSPMIVDLAPEPAKTQEQAGSGLRTRYSSRTTCSVGSVDCRNTMTGVRQLHPLVVRHTPRESV